jgi:hypothetical protein
MSGQTLPQGGIANAFVAWTWLFLAFFLLPVAITPFDTTDHSTQGDFLAAPTVLTDWLAAPVQKSKAAKLSLKDFSAVPAEEVVLPAGSFSAQLYFSTETPFFPLSTVRQSALLPRPPPIV